MSGIVGTAVICGAALAIGAAGAAQLAVQAGTDYVRDAPPAGFESASMLTPDPNPSVVVMGVFYARELGQRGHSLNALDEVSERLIGYTNEALQRSNVPLTLQLAYAHWYDEPLDGIGTSMAWSQFGERMRAQRTTLLTDYGVDIAVLLKAADDVDSYFGFASIGTEWALQEPTFVPSAVVCFGKAQTNGLECFGNGGIFAHEVGHLFGAGHQRDASETGGAFPFSFASSCGGGTLVYTPVTSAQQIYSTPAISVGGVPCGVAASEGDAGVDNAHTIDLLRALAADLRPAMPVHGTVTIDGLAGYSLTEGDPADTFIVTRDGDLSMTASVGVDIASPANGSDDLQVDPGVVQFGPGQDRVSVRIQAVDDVAAEGTEVLELRLRNPLRLASAAPAVRVTIADNDAADPAPPRKSGGGGGAVGVLALLSLLLIASLTRGLKPGWTFLRIRVPGKARFGHLHRQPEQQDMPRRRRTSQLPPVGYRRTR